MFPSPNSASARRVALSADALPAINSRQRSSRCCESSSTMSASRAGDSGSDDSRMRISRAQAALSHAPFAGVEGSGMLPSRDAPNGFHECGPRLSLLCQHAPPLGRHLVEPAAPLPGFFDPGTLDPSTLLEAIEQG